jgi:hypothetical protein
MKKNLQTTIIEGRIATGSGEAWFLIKLAKLQVDELGKILSASLCMAIILCSKDRSWLCYTVPGALVYPFGEKMAQRPYAAEGHHLIRSPVPCKPHHYRSTDIAGAWVHADRGNSDDGLCRSSWSVWSGGRIGPLGYLAKLYQWRVDPISETIQGGRQYSGSIN